MNETEKKVVHGRYAQIDFKYNNYVLRAEDHGGYESRHKSMINLIRDAWRAHVRNEAPPEPDRFFTLWTEDNFNRMFHFSFACPGPAFVNRCMPHFIFEFWPECGMPDYQSIFDEMVFLGGRPPDEDKAFWIGAVFDPKLYPWCKRPLGLEVSSRRPDLLDFRRISWQQRGPDQFKHTPGYVTMQYHCRHRVLFDFGGVGFSARLPLLLASGRPVVIVGRPQEAWFYWDEGFVPWVHYIPCGSKDGSSVSSEDIVRTLLWADSHRSRAEEIGRNGQAYALKNLTRKAVIDRIGSMMLSFCENMWSNAERQVGS